MGRLIVVRHGETAYNAEGRYTGRTDIGLNEEGCKQAKMLAEKLKNIPIDIIISSTLKRARETAKVINEELQLPVIEMEELIERGVGVYEGLTREEAKNRYPEMWANNTPEGREPGNLVDERVYKALNTIRFDYLKDKNVLIVTHGYVTKVINKYFNNSSEADFLKYALKNCEYEEYSV